MCKSKQKRSQEASFIQVIAGESATSGLRLDPVFSLYVSTPGEFSICCMSKHNAALRISSACAFPAFPAQRNLAIVEMVNMKR